MAQPYPPPVAAVVSPNFCAPCPVDLSIVRKVMTIADGSFVVTDLSDNIVFKVRGSVISPRHRHVLLDATGNPLLTLQQKVLGMLASRISTVLQGKDKPTYAPNMDDGHMWIVLNAKYISVTGRKMTDKVYY